jgi:hypothetical protein
VQEGKTVSLREVVTAPEPAAHASG